MMRRLFAVLSLAVLGLLAMPAISAVANPPYPAPSVDPTAPASWAPSSYEVQPATDVTSQLASTGAGLNVQLVVLVAGLIVLLGIALVIAGTVIRRRATTHAG